MARKRSDRSRNVGDLWLFAENITLGWKVLYRIGAAQGERRVAQGTAQRVNDPTGKHIGYQFCSPLPEGVARRSSAVLSRGETELLAGSGFSRGGSITARLTESGKQLRVERIRLDCNRIVPAEDAVEMAQVKRAAFLASANVRGDRAVRVYPRG